MTLYTGDKQSGESCWPGAELQRNLHRNMFLLGQGNEASTDGCAVCGEGFLTGAMDMDGVLCPSESTDDGVLLPIREKTREKYFQNETRGLTMCTLRFLPEMTEK